MGADSMTRIRDTSGEAPREKLYSNANKVFEIPALPIVAMTYGVGAIGRRSIESLIREWADGREPYEKRGYTVEEVAQSLCEFVFEPHRRYVDALRHEAEERQAEALSGETSRNPEEKQPFDPLEWMTGIVIGGYQPRSRYPWLYSWEQPARPGKPQGLVCVRAHEGMHGNDGPPPGIDYWGDTAALDRLRFGFDGKLFKALQGLKTDEAVLKSILSEQEWQVLIDGMPLQDAADLVKFLLDVGAGFDRFREGTTLIGGGFDIAVISRSRVHWEQRKPMTKALAIPAFALVEDDLTAGTTQKT